MRLISIKILAFTTLITVLISVVLLGYISFNYPFKKPDIQAVVPVDKTVYYPGDTVGFIINICLTSWKLSETSFQIESERNDNFYFRSLGTYKSVGFPGCFKVKDISVHIPIDFFSSSKDTREGKHRIFVIIENPQNQFANPIIFETDWFDVRKK